MDGEGEGVDEWITGKRVVAQVECLKTREGGGEAKGEGRSREMVVGEINVVQKRKTKMSGTFNYFLNYEPNFIFILNFQHIFQKCPITM